MPINNVTVWRSEFINVLLASTMEIPSVVSLGSIRLLCDVSKRICTMTRDCHKTTLVSCKGFQ